MDTPEASKSPKILPRGKHHVFLRQTEFVDVFVPCLANILCSCSNVYPVHNRVAPKSVHTVTIAPQTRGARDHSALAKVVAALEVLELPPEDPVLEACPLPEDAVPVEAPPAF
jgi:hypothetical protein